MKEKAGFIYWNNGEDGQVTNNFSLSEFACKCDEQHEHKISKRLLLHLQEYRDFLNTVAKAYGLKNEIKIKVNSAFRCKEHNHIVGGRPKSKHPLGIAADLKIVGFRETDYEEAGMNARAIGFTGIGMYPTFVHVDVRDGSKYPMGFVRWRPKK